MQLASEECWNSGATGPGVLQAPALRFAVLGPHVDGAPQGCCCKIQEEVECNSPHDRVQEEGVFLPGLNSNFTSKPGYATMQAAEQHHEQNAFRAHGAVEESSCNELQGCQDLFQRWLHQQGLSGSMCPTGCIHAAYRP